ncbi:MAG: response regulator [Gammaproteobacteria bacterium]
MRLLLIEDDPMLGDGITAGFDLVDWRCEWVTSMAEARSALATDSFDGVVLDRGLPDGDGLDLLGEWRRQGNAVPVLVLTAMDSIMDRVDGLDSGADDYLIKPFDLDELTARMRALVRRAAGRAEPLIQLGDVSLNPASREVFSLDEPVALTGREYSILESLMNAGGRTVTRERLDECLHGWDDAGEGNSLEVHVHKLRRKLGKTFIRTVRGVGYSINASGKTE